MEATYLIRLRLLRSVGFVLLAGWMILSIGALAQFLDDSAGAANGEFKVRLAWQLLVLNFPISLVVSLFAAGEPIYDWCLISFCGFLQWVILVPLFGRALRQHLFT